MIGTLSFGYDGERGLGDRLLAAVFRGEKTAGGLGVARHLTLDGRRLARF